MIDNFIRRWTAREAPRDPSAELRACARRDREAAGAEGARLATAAGRAIERGTDAYHQFYASLSPTEATALELYERARYLERISRPVAVPSLREDAAFWDEMHALLRQGDEAAVDEREQREYDQAIDTAGKTGDETRWAELAGLTAHLQPAPNAPSDPHELVTWYDESRARDPPKCGQLARRVGALYRKKRQDHNGPAWCASSTVPARAAGL